MVGGGDMCWRGRGRCFFDKDSRGDRVGTGERLALVAVSLDLPTGGIWEAEKSGASELFVILGKPRNYLAKKKRSM